MNVSRRWAVVAAIAASAFLGGATPLHADTPGKEAPNETLADPTARLLRDASLMLMKEGNSRYLTGKSQHPHLEAERRASTVAQGQEPFATVLACSDSRDPVELIFDRGVGDLFVVRVAGNIAGNSELATIEYGVGHLNTPLLVVMGHTKCGAVTAVVKGAELHGHLHELAEHIKPAVERARTDSSDTEETIQKAIQANVWQSIEDVLRESNVVREKIRAGRLSILGALYDLESGKVTWLGPHPAQEAVVALAEQAATDTALARKLAAHESTASGHPESASASPAPGPAGRRVSPPSRPPAAVGGDAGGDEPPKSEQAQGREGQAKPRNHGH